jgi:hypothetical protein
MTRVAPFSDEAGRPLLRREHGHHRIGRRLTSLRNAPYRHQAAKRPTAVPRATIYACFLAGVLLTGYWEPLLGPDFLTLIPALGPGPALGAAAVPTYTVVLTGWFSGPMSCFGHASDAAGSW